MLNINKYKYFNILLFILPFFLILSSAISTLIVTLIALLGLFLYLKIQIKSKHIKNIVFFYLLWCVLILLSSLLSNNILLSFESSLFYFRFIFFSFFIFIYLKYKKNLLFEISLLLIIFILLIDASIQYYFGQNIIGSVSPSDRQITSLFGDKRVLGSYLSRFSPILIIIAIQSYKNNNYIFYSSILIYLYSFFGVIISGERSSILYYLFVFVFIFLIVKIKLRYKIVLIFIISLLVSLILISNDKIKTRIIDTTVKQYYKDGSFTLTNTLHYNFLQSSMILFKENSIMGIGPKNFRVECAKTKIINACSTHPHNTYIQILTETGLVGFVPFITFYFYILLNFAKYFFFIIYKNYTNKVDLIIFISLLNIVINFFPFLPNGNFFGSWLSIFYFFPIGYFFYGLDKKLNL